MEPDILASVGEPRTLEGPWREATQVQTEESKTVETPSDIPNPRAVRMHAVTAHSPVLPRVRSHAGGFANGHARAHLAAPTSWRAHMDAATAPAVLPFETPA